MFKKDSAPEYFWFQALRILLEESGPFNPRFAFWESIIGGSEGQDLYHTESFCELGDPGDLDWSIDNFLVYGSEGLLSRWAKKRLFDRYCNPGGGGG